MKIMALYKHKYNTDVALAPLKSFYIEEKDCYKLKVEWFNIVNPNNIYPCGIKETLSIDRKIWINDWEPYP